MLNELRVAKYIVEFFQSGKQGAVPTDRLHLKAEADWEAITQANWLARHTHHNHFQVRDGGTHTIIYRSSPLARVA
jgi:hypothetical protein